MSCFKNITNQGLEAENEGLPEAPLPSTLLCRHCDASTFEFYLDQHIERLQDTMDAKMCGQANSNIEAYANCLKKQSMQKNAMETAYAMARQQQLQPKQMLVPLNQVIYYTP
jgi:hypothetical protein